jgi:hypothetical protein
MRIGAKPREKRYRKWGKPVARTLDWVDDDG